jgi:hypothetical protein
MAVAASHLCIMPVSHLCNMPDEVIHTIIARLDDMRAVLRLAQTSHRFAFLASRPELWRERLQDHWAAAAVAECEHATGCPMTCLARLRVVPTVLRVADFETVLEPESFVPAPLREYRILVEIMHEGRVVLTQAVQLTADRWSLKFDLMQREFSSHDRDWPAFPSREPAASFAIETWREETEAFFSRSLNARLCVLHPPSGRVVCLGVESGSCLAIPSQNAEDGQAPAEAEVEMRFVWRVRTPILPESVFKQIEEGFDEMNIDELQRLECWDLELDPDETYTRGIKLRLYADLIPAPG